MTAGKHIAPLQQWKDREFFERGKPVTVPQTPPRYTYFITNLYNDLWTRVQELQRPYDALFALEDEDITVYVRVVRSEVALAESWSVSGQPYIFNNCAARREDILQQLDAALQRRV